MVNERLSNDLDGQNFENLNHGSSKITGNILVDDLCDPDLNFCNINFIKNIVPPSSPYIILENPHTFIDDSEGKLLSFAL